MNRCHTAKGFPGHAMLGERSGGRADKRYSTSSEESKTIRSGDCDNRVPDLPLATSTSRFRYFTTTSRRLKRDHSRLGYLLQQGTSAPPQRSAMTATSARIHRITSKRLGRATAPVTVALKTSLRPVTQSWEASI
jgi:hypothetical protein